MKEDVMGSVCIVIRMGDMRNAHKISLREPEGKRPPGKVQE
jgi:hypothetical protein